MSSGPSGDPNSVIERRLSERLLERSMAGDMTVRCVACSWSFTGAAGDGIREHEAHRLVEHPELRAKARKRGSAQGGANLKVVRHDELADDEREAVEAARQRRARLNGIDGELAPWAS